MPRPASAFLLQASLLDLAFIASRLRYASTLTDTIWSLNGQADNGVHNARYYTDFGTGVHIHPANDSPWPGQTLWGHYGEAYGLYAAAFYAPGVNVAFSYAVTGTPETPPARSPLHPCLNTFTAPLMQAVISAYAESPAAR